MLKIRIPLLVLTAVLTTGVATYVAINNSVKTLAPSVKAGEPSYSFHFDGSSALYDNLLTPSNKAEADAYSSTGGKVTFLHNGLLGKEGVFQTFKAGGYLENEFLIDAPYHNRIANITGIEFSTSASGLKAYFGVGHNDAVNWTRNTALGTGSYSLAGLGEFSYIRIVNEGSSDVDLNSITITYSCDNISMDNLVTYSAGSTAKFSKPSGTYELYIPEEVGGNTITTIGSKTFELHSNLAKLVLPDSVTIISSNAFYGCSSLKEASLGNRIETLGSYCFQNCSSLSAIALPETLSTINQSAFQSCSSLAEIELPDALTSISNSVFQGCSSLAAVGLPNALKTIGDYAFKGCSGLTTITLPETLSTINQSAFQSCSSLAAIELPDALTSISNFVFQGCSSLAAVGLPNALTSIGECAFKGCTSLTTITLPKTVNRINDYAFDECANLTELIYEGTKEEWGSVTFGDSWKPAGLTQVNCSNGVLTLS